MEKEIVQPKVINCSSYKLTPSQISLLKRGLKFTPVPKSSNLNELSADLKSFSRKMRLNEFYGNKSNNSQCKESESIFKKPSHFTPLPERDSQLDMYCDFLKSITDNLESLPVSEQKDNLTKYERQLLKNWLTHIGWLLFRQIKVVP